MEEGEEEVERIGRDVEVASAAPGRRWWGACGDVEAEEEEEEVDDEKHRSGAPLTARRHGVRREQIGRIAVKTGGGERRSFECVNRQEMENGTDCFEHEVRDGTAWERLHRAE